MIKKSDSKWLSLAAIPVLGKAPGEAMSFQGCYPYTERYELLNNAYT